MLLSCKAIAEIQSLALHALPCTKGRPKVKPQFCRSSCELLWVPSQKNAYLKQTKTINKGNLSGLDLCHDGQGIFLTNSASGFDPWHSLWSDRQPTSSIFLSAESRVTPGVAPKQTKFSKARIDSERNIDNQIGILNGLL